MNELLIRCPKCGFSFESEESHVGLSTSCANCGSEFVISTLEEAPSAGSERFRPEQIPVTSGDIRGSHEILGMVCFTVGTRGEMRSQYDLLKAGMTHRLAAMRTKGQVSEGTGVGQMIAGFGVDSNGQLDVSGLYSGASFRSNDLEIAFHIAVSQLQLRTKYLGGNAVIAFRYDIDYDSNFSVLNFMATGYGTAVRIPT